MLIDSVIRGFYVSLLVGATVVAVWGLAPIHRRDEGRGVVNG